MGRRWQRWERWRGRAVWWLELDVSTYIFRRQRPTLMCETCCFCLQTGFDGLHDCALDDIARRWQYRAAQTKRAGVAAFRGNAGAVKLMISVQWRMRCRVRQKEVQVQRVNNEWIRGVAEHPGQAVRPPKKIWRTDQAPRDIIIGLGTPASRVLEFWYFP